jgi:large subunit ribosomal protein L24
MHVRKDDMVVVMAGDDKNTTRARKVLRVYPASGKLLVEGVNRVYKHIRPNRRNPQGGRLSREMPIDASNVMLFCHTCSKGVRVGHRYADDGRKERYCKKCGTGLGWLSKARPRYARQA